MLFQPAKEETSERGLKKNGRESEKQKATFFLRGGGTNLNKRFHRIYLSEKL